jgi:crossover junction endodeoxyribonuclease RusA
VSTELLIQVDGLPAPQGSKRHVGNGVMVESSKKVAPWRQAVTWCAKEAAEAQGWQTPAGPVAVDVAFYMPRPRYHYRTGAHAHLLRSTAPTWVDKKPDADKLVRSSLDALALAGVIRDDAQVAEIRAQQLYAPIADGDRTTPGARIIVRLLGERP